MKKSNLNVRVLAMLKQNAGSLNDKKARDILDNLELGWQTNGDIEISNVFTLEKANVSGSMVLNTSLIVNLDDTVTLNDFMQQTKVVCRGTDKIKNVEVLDFKVVEETV